jgi:Fic family protein
MARISMFRPVFIITPAIAKALMHIEALKQEIDTLPITPTVLASLRETARLESIHYSTYIEGNRLTQQEVKEVIHQSFHVSGRERDEKEVLGYYVALNYMESLIKDKTSITEHVIKMIHALIMAGGKKRVNASHYRDGQNVIRESSTRAIVYLPPAAKDVPVLMKELVAWISATEKEKFPSPLQAAIAHYQYATIHPYYDGNGRTARILTTLILHKGGYGLKGIYSLEKYYAKNLHGYYKALSIGPSHNYYLGREQADITPWIEYFCLGMVDSFEHVKKQAIKAQKRNVKDVSNEINSLDVKQRKAVLLFKKKNYITSNDIALLFNLKPRTARMLCQQWVQENFLTIFDSSKKKRTYVLSSAVSRDLK